jgi:hypothetical protein
VALVGLVAGVVVTGLPTHVPSDVTSAELRSPAVTTSTRSERAPRAGERATRFGATTITSTTNATATTSSTTTTAPPANTTSPTTTPPTTTAAAAPTTAAPGQLVVVVANAGAADLLAARMAAVIAPLGYTQAVATTAIERRPTSVVLFAPGRDQAALAFAAALGIASTEVQPFTGAPVTIDDARGDLWLLVGNDQLGRFNPIGVG